MQLTLSGDEAEMLRKVLESYLGDLRMEIARTDSRDYRGMLKREAGFLRRVIEELDVTNVYRV